MIKGCSKNIIILVVAVLILGGGALFYFTQNKGNQGQNNQTQQWLSDQEAAEKAITFLNENLLQEGREASLIAVVEESGMYKFTFTVTDDTNEYSLYITKDGKFLFADPLDLEPDTSQAGAETEVETSDKPDVKLFVMSYCPYGLQAEKMYIPVYNLLGAKADMGIYFVDYIMHDKIEIDENLRQYCIQKEEIEKYSAYLSCFVKSGDYEECYTETGINTAVIDNCYFDTDVEFNITSLYNNQETWLGGAYPQFNIHQDLNEQYGIQGSPTIVINDAIASLSTRSPEAFKELVCSAFNNPPEECSQTLSTEVASTGFGGGTGSDSGGTCE